MSFDLRGVPPSLEEIDVFLANENANVYESLVDNFLSSQSYGERMAIEWLDLARYADSHGYQDDLERSQWPWRDWVINLHSGPVRVVNEGYPMAIQERRRCVVLNRDEGPGGVSSVVSVGTVSSREAFDAIFEIGLKERAAFSFFVDAFAIPGP